MASREMVAENFLCSAVVTFFGSLICGPSTDKRGHPNTVFVVCPIAFHAHIWVENVSVRPPLSVWVRPLGWLFLQIHVRVDRFERDVCLVGPLEMLLGFEAENKLKGHRCRLEGGGGLIGLKKFT
jgi:hypothetical protein